MTTEERIRNRRIGIIGMGRSGLAAANLAAKLGGQVLVSDSAEESKLLEQIGELKKMSVPFETGGHSEQLLECDYLVLSPGVPLNIEILKKAQEKGIPIFSEIEFGYWVCQGTIIAVTGSNGKTTTTTLIGKIFEAAGYNTFVCGNIGLPFCDVADKLNKDDIAVVEISTFQLEAIEDFKPHVALILNLSPDHLDRHGSFDAYKALKYRIAENQTSTDFLVLNEEDELLMIDDFKSGAEKLLFTTKDKSDMAVFVSDNQLVSNYDNEKQDIIDINEILIPGPHNLQNAATAVCVSSIFKIEPKIIKEVLRTFAGVEHRLEKLGQVAGVNFVNDSKATNVESVCYAIRSVAKPIYLIAGGRDKGAPYDKIAEIGKDKIKEIYAIGEAKEKIFEQLGKTIPVHLTDKLENAVQLSFEKATPGSTVLLSPGCASFDMFENYEHRGQVFKEAVASLKGHRNEKVNS